ncbi:hypothetical protein LO762_05800 [Actinocorallia sp. API 0066]|uniref:hypothetical protein n=1 Tax=Actinocorallia sp. API 0066 TaxID=2896846 RepID=UPI001E440A69|nr:hypothetical protein [Actinocorallia sp. API 0066]MCD0448709.1 hypothetical protein [Actinocorallia sp. API 0066]
MRTVLPVLLLLVLFAPPVAAHEHPGGSVDRVTPGAVRVEVGASVEITLLDDRAALRRFTRTYTVDLGAGSGFTVAPDGTVVTATRTVTGGQDPAVYAANRIFAEYFEQDIPADFAKHTAGTGDLDFRLQSCYPPERSNSTCTSTVTPVVKIFPYVDPALPEGLPAEVLHTGASPTAPAVLRVTKGAEDKTLPTLPLAAAFGDKIAAIDVMTYKQRPSVTVTPTVDIAHFDPPGSRTLKQEDRDRVTKLVAADGDGGAVIDDAHSEVVGMVTSTGTDIQFATVEDIHAALKEAGATAYRGPVDVVFETALAHYHDRSYSLAIPVLQQVLKLRPDHAVAISHLRDSQAWKGTDKEAQRPGADEGGSGFWSLWSVGAAVLLVLALGTGVLLLRRPRREQRHNPDEMATAVVVAEPLRVLPPAPQAPPLTTVDRSEPGPPSPASAPATPFFREPGPADRPAYCTQCGMRRGPAHRFCGFCGHPA